MLGVQPPWRKKCNFLQWKMSLNYTFLESEGTLNNGRDSFRTCLLLTDDYFDRSTATAFGTWQRSIVMQVHVTNKMDLTLGAVHQLENLKLLPYLVGPSLRTNLPIHKRHCQRWSQVYHTIYNDQFERWSDSRLDRPVGELTRYLATLISLTKDVVGNLLEADFFLIIPAMLRLLPGNRWHQIIAHLCQSSRVYESFEQTKALLFLDEIQR
jgi:hypothetical protein